MATTKQARSDGAAVSGDIPNDGDDASVTDRPRYGAGALLLTFLGAQLLSSIAYTVATMWTT